MKILFLGLLYQKEDEKSMLFKSNTGLQGASNAYQWNLITGFDEILENNIEIDNSIQRLDAFQRLDSINRLDSLQILNSLPIGTYPRFYNQLIIKSKLWSHRSKVKGEDIGFINLPILKQIIRFFVVRRKIRQWCSENPGEELVVIAYSLYLPYLKALYDIKKIDKKLIICLIVPDLPNAFGFHKRFYMKKLLKQGLERLQYQYANVSDSYVLLTKDMRAPLVIDDKPYIVVEGVCNPNKLEYKQKELSQEDSYQKKINQEKLNQEALNQKELNQEEQNQEELNRKELNQKALNQKELNQKELNQEEQNQEVLNQKELNQNESNQEESNSIKLILYTGALNKRFGLDKLMKAFHSISQENYRLWICGVGDYQSEIELAAKEDSRISYYGYVSSDRIYEMQQQSTLLINPRPNEEEYTSYSFPSKTIEYMVSGKPVLMFKLNGIPDEYDEYLYYIRENTVEGIKAAIIEVSEKAEEELQVHSIAARDFILNKKNARVQAERILEMLQNMTHKVMSKHNNDIFPIVNNESISNNNEDILHSKQINTEDSQYLNLIYTAQVKTILQINITSGYGSTGKIVEEIHNHLTENGYRSYIAYSAFSSRIKKSFKIENKFENYTRRVMNRYFGKKYIHSTLGTLRLIRQIKRLHPDLIHLHNIQQNSVHFPMLLSFLKKYGVPVVYTLHDCWPFTGGCYHFTELDCDGYMTGCKEQGCKLSKAQRDLCNQTTDQIYEEKNKALHALDKLQIICVSRWLRSCAEQSYLSDLPLQVIYNGIDMEIFHPVSSGKRAELGIFEAEFIILGVANHWTDKKGLEVFTNLSKVIGYPYRIVLVGRKPSNCPANILVVDWTDNMMELVKLYSCADVFLNASKEETFGLAAAEAMACGTPVIAYNSTACGEVVGKNTGVVLKTHEIEELLIALENIKFNGKDRYREECINNIKERFSKEEMLLRYLKVYEEMMSDVSNG